jgi:hypothetical protein
MSSMLNLCNLYADMGNTATEDQFASLLGIQQQHLEEIITKHNFDVTVMMTLQAFKVYAESMGSYEVINDSVSSMLSAIQALRQKVKAQKINGADTDTAFEYCALDVRLLYAKLLMSQPGEMMSGERELIALTKDWRAQLQQHPLDGTAAAKLWNCMQVLIDFYDQLASVPDRTLQVMEELVTLRQQFVMKLSNSSPQRSGKAPVENAAHVKKLFQREQQELVVNLQALLAVYIKQQEFAKAERLCAEILGIILPDHLTTSPDAYDNSSIMRRNEESSIDVTNSMSRSVYTPQVLQLHITHASLLRSLNKGAEAELTLLKCLDNAEIVFGKNDPCLLVIINNLSNLYTDQHMFDKAEKLSIACYEQAVQLFGKDDMRTISFGANLALLYTVIPHMEDKAIELLEDCANRAEQLFGIDDERVTHWREQAQRIEAQKSMPLTGCCIIS